MQSINARWLAVLGITLIAIYLCWLIVMPFMDVLLWALVLAIVFSPLNGRLRDRGWGDTWAALASVGVVILVALVPILLVTISVIAQLPAAVDTLKAGLVHAKEFLDGNSRVAVMVRDATGGGQTIDVKDLGEQLKGAIAPLTQQTLGIVGGVLGTGLKIGFALFTLFYLLRDSRTITPAVMKMLPLEEAQTKAVFKRCREVIRASVQGVMVIAALQGALVGAALWVLGIPSAVLWGFVAFVFSMIPMLGSAIVWGPAALYLAAGGHYVQAIGLAIWGGLLIGSLDNVLRPRLVGQRAGLHDLIIFFSVLGGLQVFGILGLFVGPVVVAVALAVVEIFRQMTPMDAPSSTTPASPATLSTPGTMTPTTTLTMTPSTPTASTK